MLRSYNKWLTRLVAFLIASAGLITSPTLHPATNNLKQTTARPELREKLQAALDVIHGPLKRLTAEERTTVDAFIDGTVSSPGTAVKANKVVPEGYDARGTLNPIRTMDIRPGWVSGSSGLIALSKIDANNTQRMKNDDDKEDSRTDDSKTDDSKIAVTIDTDTYPTNKDGVPTTLNGINNLQDQLRYGSLYAEKIAAAQAVVRAIRKEINAEYIKSDVYKNRIATLGFTPTSLRSTTSPLETLQAIRSTINSTISHTPLILNIALSLPKIPDQPRAFTFSDVKKLKEAALANPYPTKEIPNDLLYTAQDYFPKLIPLMSSPKIKDVRAYLQDPLITHQENNPEAPAPRRIFPTTAADVYYLDDAFKLLTKDLDAMNAEIENKKIKLPENRNLPQLKPSTDLRMNRNENRRRNSQGPQRRGYREKMYQNNPELLTGYRVKESKQPESVINYDEMRKWRKYAGMSNEKIDALLKENYKSQYIKKPGS